ncbi:MAG: hypothetical protein JXR53_06030 [Bacteroidales bacterium]|nr:hypothetical protein [Bacteroidales bacterium]
MLSILVIFYKYNNLGIGHWGIGNWGIGNWGIGDWKMGDWELGNWGNSSCAKTPNHLNCQLTNQPLL